MTTNELFYEDLNESCFLSDDLGGLLSATQKIMRHDTDSEFRRFYKVLGQNGGDGDDIVVRGVTTLIDETFPKNQYLKRYIDETPKEARDIVLKYAAQKGTFIHYLALETSKKNRFLKVDEFRIEVNNYCKGLNYDPIKTGIFYDECYLLYECLCQFLSDTSHNIKTIAAEYPVVINSEKGVPICATCIDMVMKHKPIKTQKDSIIVGVNFKTGQKYSDKSVINSERLQLLFELYAWNSIYSGTDFEMSECYSVYFNPPTTRRDIYDKKGVLRDKTDFYEKVTRVSYNSEEYKHFISVILPYVSYYVENTPFNKNYNDIVNTFREFASEQNIF